MGCKVTCGTSVGIDEGQNGSVEGDSEVTGSEISSSISISEELLIVTLSPKEMKPERSTDPKPISMSDLFSL